MLVLTARSASVSLECLPFLKGKVRGPSWLHGSRSLEEPLAGVQQGCLVGDEVGDGDDALSPDSLQTHLTTS